MTPFSDALFRSRRRVNVLYNKEVHQTENFSVLYFHHSSLQSHNINQCQTFCRLMLKSSDLVLCLILALHAGHCVINPCATLFLSCLHVYAWVKGEISNLTEFQNIPIYFELILV